MLVYRKDRSLKEIFNNCINDDDMMTKIIRELAAIKKRNEIACDQVIIAWTKKAKVKRAQKVLTEGTKVNKEFHTVNRHEQKNNALNKAVTCRWEAYINCNYCGNTHEP